MFVSVFVPVRIHVCVRMWCVGAHADVAVHNIAYYVRGVYVCVSAYACVRLNVCKFFFTFLELACIKFNECVLFILVLLSAFLWHGLCV